MDRMNDKIAQEQFLNFMKVDGIPIVSVQMMDWLTSQGFFKSLLQSSTMAITQAVCLNTP